MKNQTTNIYLKYKNERGDWLQKNASTDKFLQTHSETKVSQNLQLVGNSGRYQYYVITILAFSFLIMGFLNTILAYTYYVPEFHCLKNNISYKCSQKEACELGHFDVVKKRISVVTEFELYCGKKKLMVTSSQSFIFVFAALITFSVAIFSDKIGRKRCFYVMIFCAVLGGLFAIFSNGLFFIVFGVLLIWTSTDIFYSIALIYSNEIMSDYLRSKVSLFFIIAAMGSISINFILILIPSYKGFYVFCFIFILIISIFFTKFIFSPFYIFSTGDLKKYYDVLIKISNRNLKDEKIISTQLKEILGFDQILSKDIDTVETLKIDQKKLSLSQKIRSDLKKIFSKDHRKTILLCLIYYTNNYINQCVGIIMPQKLGLDNIYIMGTLLCIADLLGYLIILPFSHTIKRRYLNACCNIAYIIGGLLLLINESNKGKASYKVYATGLSCFLRLVNSACFSLAFNYISELFPTRIRGLATGLIVCTGRLSNCLASTFEHLSTIYDLHPLILTAIPAVFALPACLFLPETVNKNLIN